MRLDKEQLVKILVVGSGGREHAIIKKLKEDPRAEKIYALPGNGGIAQDAECVDIQAMDLHGIVKFARENKIDLAVVAPDDPLVAGTVDALEAAGVACFGPRKDAAMLEGSKVFAKEFMTRHNIPTGSFAVFNNSDKAMEYVEKADLPIVIKADGLALGKGVIIAETREEAQDAIKHIMKERAFGDSGARVVIEEYLTGPEVSVLAFTDGKTIVPMVSSMDHKRALDGDMGKNTGGMGTIAPNPYYTDEIAEQCMEEIFLPTIRGMAKEGSPFKGCLYFGLMLTPDGPKVIEYNSRFGDPEAQVVLPLLDSSLLEIMLAVSEGRLRADQVQWKDKKACCVVIASGGYPQKYATGYTIELPEAGEDEEIYVAGARLKEGRLITSGGRVINVTALGDTLEEAIERAYALAHDVHFENSYVRRDIGARALAAEKEG